MKLTMITGGREVKPNCVCLCLYSLGIKVHSSVAFLLKAKGPKGEGEADSKRKT